MAWAFEASENFTDAEITGLIVPGSQHGKGLTNILQCRHSGAADSQSSADQQAGRYRHSPSADIAEDDRDAALAHAAKRLGQS